MVASLTPSPPTFPPPCCPRINFHLLSHANNKHLHNIPHDHHLTHQSILFLFLQSARNSGLQHAETNQQPHFRHRPAPTCRHTHHYLSGTAPGKSSLHVSSHLLTSLRQEAPPLQLPMNQLYLPTQKKSRHHLTLFPSPCEVQP